jgi:hypothetical protein
MQTTKITTATIRNCKLMRVGVEYVDSRKKFIYTTITTILQKYVIGFSDIEEA